MTSSSKLMFLTTLLFSGCGIEDDWTSDDEQALDLDRAGADALVRRPIQEGGGCGCGTGTPPPPPPPVAPAVGSEVAVGYEHACTLFTGGRVLCWGSNNVGQLGNGTTVRTAGVPALVSGLSGATAVAAASFSTCALVNSRIKCWGYNTTGALGNGTTVSSSTPVTVSGISTATSMELGAQHACARLSDSTVWCWGSNTNGRLGDGTTVQRNAPVLVSGIFNASGVAAGFNHTCANLGDATVKCWGANFEGQLGDGTTAVQRVTPVAVSGLTNVAGISSGSRFSCARLADSTLKCWGSNAYGQLGNGTTVPRLTAFAVFAISTADLVDLGDEHACATLHDGTLKCWGRNQYGQLGDGTTVDRYAAVSVAGIAGGAVKVAAGNVASCVLLGGGIVKCWGSNSSGQIGQGTAATQFSPVMAGPLTINKVVGEVANGGGHTCVMWRDPAAGCQDCVKCWGQNWAGQLGNGTTIDSANEVTVAGISTASAISAGSGHTCARLADSTVKCWGYNIRGQLGDGTTVQRATPVPVFGIANALGVELGGFHTCAYLDNLTVKCWGSNSRGQLGNGTTVNSFTPVTVNGIVTATSLDSGGDGDLAHTCARLSDSTVKCWGYNANGQLGDGTTTQRLTPVAVLSLAGASSVAAGKRHTCALINGSVVNCWGSNSFGELGDGTTTQRLIRVAVSGISTATSVSLGISTSCSLLSDKSVKCWGYGGAGGLGTGSTDNQTTPVSVPDLYTATQISAGGSTCARLNDGTVKCWGMNLYGYSEAYTMPTQLACSALEVERSDYFAPYRTAFMPNAELNGQDEELYLYRAKPVFPAGCPLAKALLLVHGRTVEGVSIWDLQYQGLSFMEKTAMAGIDTYVVSMLGFGKSTHPVLEEACNASLPLCPDCIPPIDANAGISCDCPGAPAANTTLNQQGTLCPDKPTQALCTNNVDQATCSGTSQCSWNSGTSKCTCKANQCCETTVACQYNGSLGSCVPTYLKTADFSSATPPCAHKAGNAKNFTDTNVFVDNIDKAVSYIIANFGHSKVNLLGYSAGGAAVGVYLGDAGRRGKIDRVILASAGAGNGASPPTDNPTMPLGLVAKSDMSVNFNTATATCRRGDGCISTGCDVACTKNADCTSGHCTGCAAPPQCGADTATCSGTCAPDPDCSCDVPGSCGAGCPGSDGPGAMNATMDQVWSAMLAQDATGQAWGSPDHVTRFPQASRWGWTPAVQAQISNPTLLMNGLKDVTIAVGASSTLYCNFTGTTSKALVQIGCASHGLFWEQCTGPTCNGWRGPSETAARQVINWINTGLVYAAPSSPTGTFVTSFRSGAAAFAAPSTQGPEILDYTDGI